VGSITGRADEGQAGARYALGSSMARSTAGAGEEGDGLRPEALWRRHGEAHVDAHNSVI
jgi:hypothetical protein